MAREGTRFRFGPEVFWAERGMIRIENRHTGEYRVVMVRDFLLRARAILRGSERLTNWPRLRNRLQTFVEQAIMACRQARDQGRPDDPKAAADVAKERGKLVLGVGSVVDTSAGRADLLPPILDQHGVPFRRAAPPRDAASPDRANDPSRKEVLDAESA